MERQMTEAVTITNEELAILCDIVAGWSVKKAESLDRDKQQALDRLIANRQRRGHQGPKPDNPATRHVRARLAHRYAESEGAEFSVALRATAAFEGGQGAAGHATNSFRQRSRFCYPDALTATNRNGHSHSQS
jgi:hypothetical protein